MGTIRINKNGYVNLRTDILEKTNSCQYLLKVYVYILCYTNRKGISNIYIDDMVFCGLKRRIALECLQYLKNNDLIIEIDECHYQIVGFVPCNDRGYADYIKWRKDVIKRDNNTCQECGDKENLHAHHIKSFCEYPDLRTELDNGITLCKDCHKKVHSLGYLLNCKIGYIHEMV